MKEELEKKLKEYTEAYHLHTRLAIMNEGAMQAIRELIKELEPIKTDDK